jgi:hypothetical protein
VRADRRLLLALAALAAVLPAPVAAASYGSGAFGDWVADSHGLPAYRYDIDEESNPIARQPELAGSTDAWSQVGNDRVVANAYNHGYVQLWSQDRLYQWMNLYDAAHNHFAGGFGYIKAGGRVISTLYDDRPAGSSTERRFGAGYYAKRLRVPGLSESDTVYAPFGDDSLLLHDVRITNGGDQPLSGSYFEYWDVDPQIQAVAQIPRGTRSPAWDPKTRTLSVAQLPADLDTQPLTIFASALNAPVSGYDTDTNAFFGAGTRARPAAVAAGRLTGSIAPPNPGGVPGSAMLAFQTPFSLAPGESVTLRYAYGYAHPGQVESLVGRYRGQRHPLARSLRRWSRWLPDVSFGGGYDWLARELRWDAYTVRSGSTYEECAGSHIISQGGYYQYYFGENEAYRDPLQHALPMIWADPALARDVIAYSAQEQPQALGAIPYGRIGLCRRFDLGTSDDMDLWLLWTAAEYALATRDFGFLEHRIGFDGGGDGSLWEHLRLAFDHQELQRGPHGEYVTGATGDWNDFSTELLQMTESNLVTAQAAYIYPRVAEVADAIGDDTFAADLRTAAARDLATVKNEFVPGGWYARGYSGVRQIGAGSIYSEPQPWALLAGAASPAQAARVVAAYRHFLAGVGTRSGPSPTGSALAPPSGEPGAGEQSEPPINGSTEWPGGAWFAVNGWLTWALADLDGTVPGAAAYGWDEFLRNTLAARATTYPKHWDGILSVDDECRAHYQASPEVCGIGLTTAYDTQIMHQPAYALFDLLKLAGIEATSSGYRVVPHLPMASFHIRLPGVGLTREPGALRGYVRATAGPVTMLVAPPAGVAAGQAVVRVGGERVPAAADGELVRFVMRTRTGARTHWSVTAG